ncbi:MAG: PorT family protein, partial [Bacteroidales bacterium]|nr:PorT family protein [Bacteroidales bacterium]
EAHGGVERSETGSDHMPSSATSAAPDAMVPDTREPQSVSGEAKTAEQTPEAPNSVSGGEKASEPRQATVPLQSRQPREPRERRERQPIRIMAGVSGGLMAQNVSQSGQQAAHVASMMGSAPAIQTKSITGGTTTFDPSIINRNKPGTTECNHRQSARFAAGIKVNFLPHWGVESGIVGTTLNSSWETISGNSVKNVEQEMHYLGIPLYLHFNALDWNGLSLYLAAGPMYEFTNETSEIYSTRLNGKLLSSATDNHLQKDHRWSVNAAAGLQLEFMENNAIYIQPGLSYHFRRRNVAGLDIQNYYTARPASFNLTIGYRLLLF